MIEEFVCWRCKKRIHPEDLFSISKEYVSDFDLHEADLACQAELCSQCWREIEHSTYEGTHDEE